MREMQLLFFADLAEMQCITLFGTDADPIKKLLPSYQISRLKKDCLGVCSLLKNFYKKREISRSKAISLEKKLVKWMEEVTAYTLSQCSLEQSPAVCLSLHYYLDSLYHVMSKLTDKEESCKWCGASLSVGWSQLFSKSIYQMIPMSYLLAECLDKWDSIDVAVDDLKVLARKRVLG